MTESDWREGVSDAVDVAVVESSDCYHRRPFRIHHLDGHEIEIDHRHQPAWSSSPLPHLHNYHVSFDSRSSCWTTVVVVVVVVANHEVKLVVDAA